MSQPTFKELFDTDTQAELTPILAHLPQPVSFVVWGDAGMSRDDAAAISLCQALADEFALITMYTRPRRINYPYYPVIGIMDGRPTDEEAWTDVGVRMIGLPEGYQLTSLLAAVQSVAFRGMNLEATTRIQLSRLQQPVQIEVFSDAKNEIGPVMAQMAFGLAAASPQVRSYFIMADQFPEALVRYSISHVPHTIVNGRIHIEGIINEDIMLAHIAKAVKTER